MCCSFWVPWLIEIGVRARNNGLSTNGQEYSVIQYLANATPCLIAVSKKIHSQWGFFLADQRPPVAGGYLHVCELESTMGTQYRVQHQARDRIVDYHLYAPARLGVRGDRDTVVGDRGDDGGVLPLLEDRGLADGAVPGVGQLRERAELYDLAAEHGIRMHRV